MPVYVLDETAAFPPPENADESGLLAIGGDLSVKRLIAAYSQGIFPWYSEEMPIMWWSTDPRLVLLPDELKVSRSLAQAIRGGGFRLTVDRDFAAVISACAETPRKGEQGTWITNEMREAYIALHRAGHAHSVEAWHGGRLAGGLYGVAIGAAFFGESMFALRANASKVALVHLVGLLKGRGYEIIDCQQTTPHLVSLGAREIPRAEFLRIVRRAVKAQTTGL